MSVFTSNKNGIDIDPFTDLLFNALLTFTFLFLIALMFLNPPAKTGIIDPKAEFLITVSWEDGDPNDIDTWIEGPNGELVWFKQPQAGLMHLDRDDRGLANDMQLVNGREIINPLNQEVVTIRGRSPGEYVVNLHYYRSENNRAVPVTIYLAEVNPSMQVLHYTTSILEKEREELTAIRFTINASGKAININNLQKKIVRTGAL